MSIRILIKFNSSLIKTTTNNTIFKNFFHHRKTFRNPKFLFYFFKKGITPDVVKFTMNI